MDNKVLDEAVEVAVRAGAEAYARQIGEALAHEPDPDDLVAMRAALLAGVKVLLGEPVAYWVPNARVCSDGSYEDGPGALAHTADASEYAKQIGQPLYAPSLGEGDGR